jgi:uncharacterized membrane protein YsdA (DUF1294 family)
MDVALVAKMIANNALMLVTVTAFGNLYIDRRNTHDVWQRIFENPMALGLLLGGIAVGSAIASIATLVAFGGE